MRTRLCILVLGVLLCLPLSAQAPQPERRTFAVSVLDKDGNAVHGLTAANFRGTYRGQPVKILSATEDFSPRRIVLLMDTSKSMYGEPEKWRFAWAAAQSVVENLTPPHQVALDTFSEGVTQHSGFTADHHVLLRALQAGVAQEQGSFTNLYDALVEVVTTLPSADAVCVVTDNLVNASKHRQGEAAETLARAKVRVFGVWISPTLEFASSQVASAKNGLVDVAEASGGIVLEPRSYKPDKAAEQLHLLLEAMNATYVLEIEYPQTITKSAKWKLEAQGASGTELKGVRLTSPHLLVPQRPNNQ